VLKRRVIKLGGSLLDFQRLVPALRTWLAAQAPMPSVMIVGGGSLADAIRAAFDTHGLDEEAAHWLCIRLLGVTAELAARLLPEAVLVKQFDDLLVMQGAASLAIFEPEQFVREETSLLERLCERGIRSLPHCWDVTSDSIAARLAVLLRADELVLLKSGLPTDRTTLQEAADTGYVDRHFPAAAAELTRIRCVNLRSGAFAEVLHAPGSSTGTPAGETP